MCLDDFRPWRCQNVVNTSAFSFTSTKIALNTVFLDVFDLKYLTRNHHHNHNNNNNNNKKNIWHLVSLVRADPAAERREYIEMVYEVFLISSNFKFNVNGRWLICNFGIFSDFGIPLSNL